MDLELQRSFQLNMGSGMGAGFDAYLWIILGIMIAAGLLGGAANHFLSAWRERDAAEQTPGRWRYPVLGVTVALTAPLFLKMLSSDLVDAARIRATDFLVFAGFCIVYVVATRGIVDTLAARVTGQWKLLRRDIDDFEKMSRPPESAAETKETATPQVCAKAPEAGTKIAPENTRERAREEDEILRLEPSISPAIGERRETRPAQEAKPRTEHVQTTPEFQVPANVTEPRPLPVVEMRIEPSPGLQESASDERLPEPLVEMLLADIELSVSDAEEREAPGPEKRLSPEAQAAIELLSYNDVEIMYVIAAEAAVYGNLSALTEKTGLNRDLLSTRLTMLKNLGLIEARIDAENVLHWFVTGRGREILDELFAGQSRNQGRLRA
ncbi:MAG: hypothetical protein FWD77_10415 [Betaproteobacteria bacterium]|nr:hypothetical protein [Betaproteobacteria bacterium]